MVNTALQANTVFLNADSPFMSGGTEEFCVCTPLCCSRSTTVPNDSFAQVFYVNQGLAIHKGEHKVIQWLLISNDFFIWCSEPKDLTKPLFATFKNSSKKYTFKHMTYTTHRHINIDGIVE